MQKDVFVLTNINHYDENEIHVYANVYADLAKAKEDMLTDFKSRFESDFDSDEQHIVDVSDVWMELRRGDCYCTWGIECQTVEFGEERVALS